MKRVYASFDTIFLGYLCGLLRAEGINAEIRNEFSAGAMGELPPQDVMPEVCVDEAQLFFAEQVVKEALKPADDDQLPSWVCPECGEKVEGQFRQCWHCGYIKE